MTDTSNVEAAPVDTGAPPTHQHTTTEPAPIETAPVEQAPVEQTETSVLDQDLPAGMRTFDRSYVEKVRAEAAANRTKAREYEATLAEREAALARFAAFEGYSDEDMTVWTSMAADWKEDPAKAAVTFQRIASDVLGDPTATAQQKADAQAILDNPEVTAAAESLTPEQVREIAREEAAARDEAASREAAVRGIYAQLAEAGYEEGTARASSVLWYATQQTKGDIAAAIELQKADDQAIIDRYVAEMAAGGTPVRLPSSGGGGLPMTEQPKNISEARRMADEWMRERRGA